jgi:hypothetical protein
VVANLYDLRMMRGAGIQCGEAWRGKGRIRRVSAQSRGKRAEGHRQDLEIGIGHAGAP